LAFGLETSLLTAERVKIDHGVAHPSLIKNNEDIEFSKFDGWTQAKIRPSALMDIILPRVEEIFSIVAEDLQNSSYADVIAPGGAQTVEWAGPSTPVEVLGFSGAPDAGDRVAVVESEARAREITEYRERQRREKQAARGPGLRTSLSDMMSNLKAAGHKELPIVLKGDVQGSVEAITAAVEKLGNDEVMARVIHGGVGGITESDVTLAAASKAVILGFNVRAHKEARDLAEQDGVEIRYYNIIYNLVDDVKAALSGMLAPTMRETMLGNAQILELFHISKVGTVAGCRVTDGVVQRGAHVRLIRDSVVVHEGKLSTLKRFKDEVAQVQAGQECGMAFENYQDMRVGDVIECYSVEEIRRTL